LVHQGPGEFFGEMALIQDRPRAATVRTLQECTLLELTKEDFNALLDRNPSVALTVMRKVTTRLRDSDRMAITELRQKNIELAQAYERLEEQQRLRSAFLTTVAHELRTPLTTAQGYLQLLTSGVIQPDKAMAMVSTVGRNVDQIVDLANSILFLQELDLITPDFEPVMVGQVVAEAVANVSQKAAESNLSLKIDIAPHLPLVNGDARGLEQAIAALLDNAIKFSPEGGEIQVAVSRQDRAVGIEIADPGVGIPEDQLEQLFKPFHRVDSIGGHLFGGVGLGLPIAKHVVELHGGHIWAERRSQGGSRFSVSLPTLTA
jgi:signal transduction histidine kinase